MMTPTPTSRRRKAPPKPAPDAIPESIFDALNMNPPGVDPGKGSGAEPKKEGEASLADLLSQLSQTNQRLDSLERTTISAPAPAPAAPAPSQLREPVLNLENLPDPVSDPKTYAADLAKRMIDFQDARKLYGEERAKELKPQPGGNPEQLWEDFSETYGDYAQDQEGVDFATQKAIRVATRRGLDVNRYMYGNPDRFFRDVVKIYDERFGKPEGEGADPEPEPQPRRQPRKAAQADDDTDPGRTTGIFGGHESGSGGRKAPAQPGPGDMIKDLQDLQRRTGYY